MKQNAGSSFRKDCEEQLSKRRFLLKDLEKFTFSPCYWRKNLKNSQDKRMPVQFGLGFLRDKVYVLKITFTHAFPLLFYQKCQSFHHHHHHHHHHHVVPPARISLTLSRHFSISFITSGRSSGLHPISSHSCCMYIRADHPAFAWPYTGTIGVHHWWVCPCFSSSVLRVWFV